MNKIISIKLFNGDCYVVGSLLDKNWAKIEKFTVEDGSLWFLVVDHDNEYLEINGRFVMIVRYEK